MTKQYSYNNNLNYKNNDNLIINNKINPGIGLNIIGRENKKKKNIYKNNRKKLNFNFYYNNHEEKVSENRGMKERSSIHENIHKNEIIDIEKSIKIYDIKESKGNNDLKHEKKIEKLNYDFNFFEILFTSFFESCLTKNLSKKKI